MRLPQLGSSALMCACENGHLEVLQALLAAGAASDARDKVGGLVTGVHPRGIYRGGATWALPGPRGLIIGVISMRESLLIMTVRS